METSCFIKDDGAQQSLGASYATNETGKVFRIPASIPAKDRRRRPVGARAQACSGGLPVAGLLRHVFERPLFNFTNEPGPFVHVCTRAPRC